jgi:hypothetical protein
VIVASLLLLSLAGALQPVDLGPLAPPVRWLQTERLRADLRHSCNIEPFPQELLSAPGGASAPVSLRGPQVLLLKLERGERASVLIQAQDARGPFQDTIWALFTPGGEMSQCGQVAVGKENTLRLEARQAGLYRLLLNTGPASANAARLTVRARRWAIETLGLGAHLEDPLYYHSLRDLKLAGLNLDMLDFEGLRQEFVTDAGLAKWTAAVARWADYARRFRLRFMPAVDLGGTPYEIQAWQGCRPGLYIKHFDHYPLAPCPLDWNWWEKIYLRRGRALARLSLKNPYLVGYGLDPEMYQCWDYGHYMLSGTCFCDHCLGGFLKAQGQSTAILQQLKTGAERHQWLQKQGLLDAYDKYLEEETCKLAVRLRQELHRINPRFLLCVYVLEIGNWFCRGLARGLGTPEMPALDYAEATYFTGWHEGVQQQIERFRQWGAHVVYGGALWYGGYPPREPHAFAAQMYNFCMRAGGYWFWPGQDLHTNWTRLPVHRGAAAELVDYWHALLRANREIEAKLAAGAAYQSPLEEIKPGLVWSSRARPEDGLEWRPVQLMPLRLAGPAKLFFYVPPRLGEAEVTVQAPGPNNGATVRMISPDGGQGAEASGELDEPHRLQATGPGGVWALEITPGPLPLRELAVSLARVPPYVCSGPDALLRLPPKPGPVLAWWSFDEGQGNVVHDGSGPPAADGVAVACKWVPGVHGSALDFDGQQSHVYVRHNYSLDGLREFTLSAWVKIRRLPQPGHGLSLINKGPEAPVQHVWWWIGYPPDYSLVLEMGNEKYRYGTSFASQPLQWELNRWYAVAVTYRWDGHQAVARFYRDGQLVGEATKQEQLHTADHDIFLGAYWGGDGHVLDGALDDVRIFAEALSEPQIKALAEP